MIERYTRPEMAKIWSERNKYLQWLRVEQAVCEALARERVIPRKDWHELKANLERLVSKGGVKPEAVERHEKVIRHDIIAFTTAVAEEVGPTSRYVHFGLTSSDVLDSALALQIAEAGELILHGVDGLVGVLREKALKYRNLPTIGRSHGIFAEPTAFGLKFLGWVCEWERNRERLARAIEGARYGKLSGAVGVNAHWGPDFERKVLARLGLRREPVSTQVVPRDRHAEVFTAMAICGASLERIAVELRHLQRSEVGEALEGFSKGQKGSSAMPHKRNPISAENLTGAARLLRSYAQAALENVALWHERDISHSSVERIAFPDAMILLDYAVTRMTGVIKRLEVRDKQVKANLEKAGTTVFSGHYLLALVKAGATREEAYYWVQECALASMEGEKSFQELIAEHERVREFLPREEIRKLGSMKYQLRNVPEIYREASQTASTRSKVKAGSKAKPKSRNATKSRRKVSKRRGA